MDLRFIADAEPTPSERAALDDVLGSPGSSWEGGARLTGADGNTAAGGHAARAQRHLLLPALWALQERIGWISPGGLNELCRRLTVPPADAYGVATCNAASQLISLTLFNGYKATFGGNGDYLGSSASAGIIK